MYHDLNNRVAVITGAGSFLVSSQASYINGATLSVDGGVSARTNSPRFS